MHQLCADKTQVICDEKDLVLCLASWVIQGSMYLFCFLPIRNSVLDLVFGRFRDEDERRAEEEKARARVKELKAQGFHSTASKPPPPQPSTQHQRPPAEHNPPPTSHPPPSLQQSRLISQYKVKSTSKARERAAAEAQRMREPMVSTGEPCLFDYTIGLWWKARLIGSYEKLLWK